MKCWSAPAVERRASPPPAGTLALATVLLPFASSLFNQGPRRPRCLEGTGILGACQFCEAVGQGLFASLFLALEDLADMPPIPAF